jgi:hypothetical protein
VVSRERSWLRRVGRLLPPSIAVLGLMWLAPAASPGLVDDTPPSVNYTIDGINGTNAWYRGSSGGNYVVVHWTVSDPNSPISSTSGCEPAVRIDGPSPGTTRTCMATSDGGTTAVTTKTIKIDATAPTVATAAPTRSADSNGWYRNPVTISWGGSDATSGIASCTSLSYSGPDSASVAPSGTCTDQAGNTSSALTLPSPIKYDATAPVLAPSPDRAPNAKGWYRSPVTVTWNGSDKTSGIASCPNSATYSTGDSANASLGATCTDQAGNSTSALFALKYDSSAPTAGSAAPTRVADANGWYNHQVTINWSGSDVTSGPVSCTSLSYNGPDGGSIAPSGTCTDQAGNTSSPLTLPSPIKYDATAPVLAPSPDRSPNANGWYRNPVTVTWNGSDATSGIASCPSTATYSSPDSANATLSANCTDQAGNSASASFALKYDSTPPVFAPSPDRSPNANGWYRSPVTVTWNGSDKTSGIANCPNSAIYSTPDSANASVGATCIDQAGNSASTSFALKYDSTPPTFAPSPDRSPNPNGWYRSPVTVTWNGSDATSGIASCPSSATYSGPDSGAAAPGATCTDQAGNSASASIALKYDSTPPVAGSASPARSPDVNGWYNHEVTVNWSGSDATSGPVSCTSLSYNGPDAGSVAPSGTCTDQAGNTSAPLALPSPIQFDSTPPPRFRRPRAEAPITTVGTPTPSRSPGAGPTQRRESPVARR